MKKPGPKSSIEKITPRLVCLAKRPNAPLDLNVSAKEEWNRVVEALPSDWFGEETLSILRLYCEHVAEAEALQKMIDMVRDTAMTADDSFKRLQELIRLKESQTRAALSCATKMRITQQATWTAEGGGTKKAKGATARPWQN